MGDKVITDKDNYASIANAIRYKNGLTTKYKPSEMANAIKSLTGSGAANPKLQSKTTTPSKSRQEITYDSDYDGLEKVTVESIPSNYIVPSGTKSIMSNGNYDVSSYASADVNVSGIDTSDANATATDIKSGKTAYVNGEKITGSHVCNGIDTSDATATADNMEKDYTAYVNGEKITGSLSSGNILNLLANSSIYSNEGTPKYASATGTGSVSQPDRISISFTNNKKQIVKNGGTVTASAKATLFGDANTDDVISGKTFTSKNGLKLTGTHECQSGIDTSDATAIATNIEKGKTAYVKGEKITGELESINSITQYGTASWDMDALVLTKKREDKAIFNKTNINLKCSGSDLGDAVAEDVLAGKTFTSAAGLKVVGTGTAQSGGVQKATGTITNSKIIETGLSSIKSLIIYKSSVTAKGFIIGFYDVDIGKVTYVYCSSYSSYIKNYNYSSNTTFTIDGGTFTWNYGFAESSDEDASNMGFTSNTEYKWIVYGDA